MMKRDEKAFRGRNRDDKRVVGDVGESWEDFYQ